MRRWWFIWWVPLLAASTAVGGMMSAATLIGAGHAVASIPCVAACVLGFGVAFIDVLPESWGHDRRMRLDPRPCSDCRCINYLYEDAAEKLAAVTKDRDELREALVTLQLPPTERPPTRGET